MVKTKTTLSVNKELLEQAHERGVNISRLLEQSLRAYLEGGSQPIQQQPTQSSEKASPAATHTDIVPQEMVEELETRLGIEPTVEQLKGVIARIWGIVTELDLVDDVIT